VVGHHCGRGVPEPLAQSEHSRLTREAYDRLAPVWSETTDDDPYNGLLERPEFRSVNHARSVRVRVATYFAQRLR
jgi:hypothetical protein